VPHGFFTRRGGVSSGPFASLNCALSGKDSRDNVLENRARAARAIDTDPARLVGIHQVHGADVTHVTEPWTPGNGSRADAMVTDRRGIALGIVTGDCSPIRTPASSAPPTPAGAAPSPECWRRHSLP
jgi:hypothetical protein